MQYFTFAGLTLQRMHIKAGLADLLLDSWESESVVARRLLQFLLGVSLLDMFENANLFLTRLSMERHEYVVEPGSDHFWDTTGDCHL